MEKRFVVFIVVTMVILTGHVLLQSQLAPPPKPAGLVEPLEGEPPADLPDAISPDANQVDANQLDANQVDAELPDSPDVESVDAAGPRDVSPVASDTAAPAIEAFEQAEQRWVTLGSYLPQSTDSPLLVTFNSRGAAIERVELVGRTDSGELRYRNLDNRGGYLGHLALGVEESGCRVNVVPPGTPAATAKSSDTDDVGLIVGDVLRSIAVTGGRPRNAQLALPSDLVRFLSDTKPGETATLAVDRQVDSKLRSMTFSVALRVSPFDLIRPEPLEPAEVMPHPASFLMGLKSIGEKSLDELAGPLSPREGNWEVQLLDEPRPGVEFRFALGPAQLAAIGLDGDLELVKRYRLGASVGEDGVQPYHLEFDVEIRNRGDAPQQVSYSLDGPNGLPLEGWWYSNKIHPRLFQSAGARDILIRTDGQSQQLIGCSSIRKTALKRPESPRTALFAASDDPSLRSLRYLAVDTQYFLAALKPVDANQAGTLFNRAEAFAIGDLVARPKRLIRKTNVSFDLESTVATIDGGEQFEQSFVIFTGPKDTEVLEAYDLGDAIYYGWFEYVSRLLSVVLHAFYRVVGNFGLAIILLTVLVRSLMFPLSRKAASNAAMMQELSPEMKAIAEKYKNDMEKRAKAQQDLFRKHNYNPLGGCWLMFLQLPIFIGLYRCLSVDIELRQASLIPGIEWCSNLAGPDQLFYWGDISFMGLFEETGMLGPYFNILPIFTIVLFLAHQKLFTPPATDDQTRLQLKMMKFMTLFIGIMFFKVASGLCLYFVASSLWGIAERKLVPRPNMKSSDPPAGAKPEPRPRPKPTRPSIRPKQGLRGDTGGNGAQGSGKPRKRKRKT